MEKPEFFMNYTSMKKINYLVIIVIFALFQSLNFSGFCFSEMKYLSEKELLDRMLFGKSSHELTKQMKKQIISTRGFGRTYPNSYKITKHAYWQRHDKLSYFVNAFLSNYHYGVDIVYRNIYSSGKDDAYLIMHRGIDTCGAGSTNYIKTTISEETYLSTMSRNEVMWGDRV